MTATTAGDTLDRMIAGTARPLATALVLLLACGPTSNLDTGSSSDPQETTQGTTTQGASSSPTASTASTVDPSSTTDAAPTTGSNSTGSAMTSTTFPTTSGPLDLPGPGCGDFVCDEAELASCACPLDCGGCALPQGLQGCPAEWVGGSAVKGMTKFGPLDGHTAFFGWKGFGDTQWSDLRLFIFDSSVDLDEAKKDPHASQFFGLVLFPLWDQPEWINQGVVDGSVIHPNGGETHQALLTVQGTAGNWQQFDPMDPPRLIGTIQTAAPNPEQTEGPFDAVFCENFNSFVIAE